MYTQNSINGWDSLKNDVRKIYSQSAQLSNGDYTRLSSKIFEYYNDQIRGDMSNGIHHDNDFIGSELYYSLRSFIDQHTSKLAKEFNGLNGEDLLNKYARSLTQFCFSSTVVDGIFGYMNRRSIKEQIEKDRLDIFTINDVALRSWNDKILDKLHGNLNPIVMKLINRERSDEKIESNLLKSVLDSFLQMNINNPPGMNNLNAQFDRSIYKNLFEPTFLKSTREFYIEESEKYLQDKSVIDYAKKANKWLKDEEERCLRYLSPFTKDSLIKICIDAIILQHSAFLQAEFEKLLVEEHSEGLSVVYNLCKYINGAFKKLQPVFQKQVENTGLAAIKAMRDVEESKQAQQYVEAICEVYKRYEVFVTNAFHSDMMFIDAMCRAASSFINKNSVTDLAEKEAKSPELIARYCDSLLRKSSKNVDDSELKAKFSQVMSILKYVREKDVFQTFCAKMLSKRLVYELSASDEAEELMISNLQNQFGSEYVRKLKNMLTDVRTSRDLTGAFNQGSFSQGCIDTTLMILTSGSWPYKSEEMLTLAPELEKSAERFTKFYQSQHTGRRLSCVLTACRGEIVLNFLEKRYTFIANVAQISILCLYNSAKSFTVQEIQEELKMKPENLHTILQSIIKAGILVSSNSGNSGDSSAVIRLNEQFQSKRLKMDLTKHISRADAKKESDAIQKEIFDDRKCLIEATIVRIMKTRKTLKHAQLVSEVLNQLTPR